MISLPHSPSFCARRGAASLLALLGLIALAPGASAQTTVVKSDTFSVEMIGYNTSDPNVNKDNIFLIDPALSATFGASNTFTGAALDDQTVTVASSETIVGTTTTDTITISVPTNFVPAGTVENNSGDVVNAIDFSIGLDDSGTDTLDFTAALTNVTYTGAVGLAGASPAFSLSQNPALTNNGMSLSNAEAVAQFDTSGDPASISGADVTSFNFTIVNTAVPEPSTVATMLLGAGGLLWIIARRRVRA